MSEDSPPSLNTASDEENQAQLEQTLNPLTSQEPLGPGIWVARFVSSQYAVPVARGATLAPATTGKDLPIEQKRILFVWLCLATIINFVMFFASLILVAMTIMLYDDGNVTFSMTRELIRCVVSAIPFLIIWAVIRIWKAYNKREYRLVLLLSIVPVFVFVAYTVAYLLN
jgi:hypothetical protein